VDKSNRSQKTNPLVHVEGSEKIMAKKAQVFPKRKAASPKAAAKSVKSLKRAPSRISAAKKSTAAKTSSVRSAKRRAPKSTRTAAVKPKKRTAAKPAAARLRNTVDGCVSTLNDWRKDCANSLRKMIHKAAPKSSEKVKRSQPVDEHHGPFAWIKGHSKHVNLGFWRGVELPDPRKLLTGAGNKMRHIKLSSLKDLGKKELQELVRLAAKLNEIKGSPTRRPKGKTKHKSRSPLNSGT
jgi:hypothetical protein